MSEDRTLEVKESRVIEAMQSCSEAAAVLKVLFPKISDSKMRIEGNIAIDDDGIVVERRTGGNYANKALYLSRYYNWELKEDNAGHPVLVPTKKHIP